MYPVGIWALVPSVKFVSFYVIFDVYFASSTFVSFLRRFSRFRLRFVLFRKSRIFRDFFFPSVPPPCCSVCVFLCGDWGRSLFSVPRGGLPPRALFPRLRPSLLSSPPPRLDPAFKRSPTTPSLFSHDPAFRTQSQPRDKSRKSICHISEGENMRHTVED